MILEASALKNHYRARTWVEDELKRSIALAPNNDNKANGRVEQAE